MVKNLTANTGDLGSIPGLGRSPGGGNGNPLQYSCLGNPMDRGAWRAMVHAITKSWTQLKRLSTAHPSQTPTERQKTHFRDFSGGPVVDFTFQWKRCQLNPWLVQAEITHALWPKSQNIQQKQYVANSVKTLKLSTLKKTKKNIFFKKEWNRNRGYAVIWKEQKS